MQCSYGKYVLLWRRVCRQRRTLHGMQRSTAVDDPVAVAAYASSKRRVFRPHNIAAFPWRHEERPLPRVIEEDTELSRRPAFPIVNGELLIAHYDLGVPLWRLVFVNQWKQELAECMSLAFRQGVSGILSNTYHVPFDTLTSDYRDIDFSYEKTDSEATSTGTADGDDRQRVIGDGEISNMMDEALVDVYRSAHEAGKDRLAIRLQTVPVHAEIHSLDCYTGVSRRLLREDEELRFRFLECRMASSAHVAIRDLAAEQYTKNGSLENTVVCQVRIRCNEVFSVKDLETDSIIQGNRDLRHRQVEHLVRLEKVVVKDVDVGTGAIGPMYSQPLRQGNWIITDIDDILHGNPIV